MNKSLERAQAKVEGRTSTSASNLLKFDDVMNDQSRGSSSTTAPRGEWREDHRRGRPRHASPGDRVISSTLTCRRNPTPTQWRSRRWRGLSRDAGRCPVPLADWAAEDGVDQESDPRTPRNPPPTEYMASKRRPRSSTPSRCARSKKQVLLQTIDQKWRDHLLTLEHLRSVVGFRGYAQRDPFIFFLFFIFKYFLSLFLF